MPNPLGDTLAEPRAGEQRELARSVDRSVRRGRLGTKKADQTSISPMPTPNPTSAPMTDLPRLVEEARTSRPARSKRSSRGGIPLARRSSPPARSKIDSVSMMSFSTRPGTPTISLTRRTPWASMPRWTTRSSDAATVGTTNRAEMFSPASSGSVHVFTSASRALLACSVHMPGSPALSASSRSRHSSDRTSPTMIRLGRIRSASLTRSRSRISPVPSSPDCRVCIGTQSGCANRSSKTSSADTTRSPPGMAAAKQLRSVVLPVWVPPATRMLSPGAHRGLEERRCPRRQAAELDQVGEPRGAQHELADVDRAEAPADALRARRGAGVPPAASRRRTAARCRSGGRST